MTAKHHEATLKASNAGTLPPKDKPATPTNPLVEPTEGSIIEAIATPYIRPPDAIPSDDDRITAQDFADLGEAFTRLCTQAGESRELSLARTRMEEAVMWAAKHLAP